MKLVRNFIIVFLLMYFGNSNVGYAQEGPVTFEFSFSNPGARSIGLGGAFAALADDATAAYANPAGLVQLIEPEISLEGRHSAYTISYVAGGRASGEPSGEGIDTISGIREGFSTHDVTGLSYLSFVIPYKKWSFALYRHTMADFRHKREVNGLFGIDDEDERSGDIRSTTKLKIANYGVAAAYEIYDRFSIGLGIVYFDAELDAYSAEYATEEEDLYESNPFDYDHLDTEYYNSGSDSGMALQLGLLWRPSPLWAVGGYFRQGPRMEIRVIEVTGPANDEEKPGIVEVDETSPLHFPDVFGAGTAFTAPNGLFTASFEWSHVRYSLITDDLNDNVFDLDEVQMNDVDEYHLGLEYVVITSNPIIALRCGTWFDPAHGLNTGSGEDIDIFERTIFHGGNDQWHYSAGVGLVYNNIQIDVGFDLADTVDQLSLSAVYRF